MKFGDYNKKKNGWCDIDNNNIIIYYILYYTIFRCR